MNNSCNSIYGTCVPLFDSIPVNGVIADIVVASVFNGFIRIAVIKFRVEYYDARLV